MDRASLWCAGLVGLVVCWLAVVVSLRWRRRSSDGYAAPDMKTGRLPLRDLMSADQLSALQAAANNEVPRPRVPPPVPEEALRSPNGLMPLGSPRPPRTKHATIRPPDR